MKANQINRHAFELANSINDKILSVIEAVFDKCRVLSTKPEEPDFIAGLVIDFTPKLYEVLRSFFPSLKFSVTGVYCHQKPIVDIGLGKNPELGDILFVYFYTDKKGIRTVNSLLLQAKISKSQEVKVSSSDLHQLELYLKWPDFTYKRAGTLNGEIREVLPKAVNDGAQYLLINNSRSSFLKSRFGLSKVPYLCCALPDQILIKNNPLSCELVDFIKFKAGRVVENDPKISKDHWTKMVWELIEIAKQKASKRNNMGISDFSRIHSFQCDGLCFGHSDSKSILSDLHNDLGNGGSSEGNNDYNDEENIGLSVIVIEGSEENIQ